jgi:hypothetical protein
MNKEFDHAAFAFHWQMTHSALELMKGKSDANQ